MSHPDKISLTLGEDELSLVSGRGTVRVGGHHIPPPLSHSPAVLLCHAVKPALSPLGMFVKCKHPLHVVRQILEEPGSKSSLEVSLVAVVAVLVSPEMLLEVPFRACVPVLAVDIEVSEHVLKVKVEGLVEVLVSSFHIFTGESTLSKPIVLSPPFLIRQRFIC